MVMLHGEVQASPTPGSRRLPDGPQIVRQPSRPGLTMAGPSCSTVRSLSRLSPSAPRHAGPRRPTMPGCLLGRLSGCLAGRFPGGFTRAVCASLPCAAAGRAPAAAGTGWPARPVDRRLAPRLVPGAAAGSAAASRIPAHGLHRSTRIPAPAGRRGPALLASCPAGRG